MAAAPQSRRLPAYLTATAIVAICTLLSGVSHWWSLSEANIVMIYLAGVALTAARYGHGPALAAIALSVVSYDFFFVPPVFAFALVEKQYFITLGVMVAIGLLISELTSRLRAQLAASQLQELRTAQLYRMTREFAHLSGPQQLIPVAGAMVAETFDGDVVLYILLSSGGVQLRFGTSDQIALDPANTTAAQCVADQGRGADRPMVLPATTPLQFVPMDGLQRMIGVLGVRPRAPNRFLDAGERRMLEACASLIALSLERDQLLREAHDARTQVETEQLKNSLLTSISHDLRSPLATIAVTTQGLMEGPPAQTLAEKRDVLETIVDETRQLARQVDNLLDMGRLTSSPTPLERDWHVLEELVGVALSRLRRELAGHEVRTDIPPDFPLVWVAHDLIGQVLINLLENAVRYTPPASRIEISARRRADRAELVVADNGPGLPPGSESAVFEKFYRGATKVADGRRGLGLGLAICRGIIVAHNGEITAHNRPEGGAAFVISLPCREPRRQTTVDTPPVSAQR